MSSTPHDPFYSSPFGPFYRRHTPYMVQPEYRIYEMNKRLQSRTEIAANAVANPHQAPVRCKAGGGKQGNSKLFWQVSCAVLSGVGERTESEDSDNLWWDAFATEFFEDDATLTLSFCLEDGPKRYTIGRTLIPRYFSTVFEGGVTDLYYILKHSKESYHNSSITVDCDQCTMVTQHGKPMFTKVCTEGRLILEFTFDDLMRIKTWHFTIRQYRELVPRSILAMHAQDPQVLEQLSKNITRMGLTNFTLNYLRLCVILEPMQELMSRHKTYNLSPRDCLKTCLFQKWQRMVAPPAEPTRQPTTKRRKRKNSTSSTSNSSAGNNANSTNSKKKSAAANLSLSSQDVMVVGEPTLMGGEFGDEDERLITRLENTQYDAANGMDDEEDFNNSPALGNNSPWNSKPPANQETKSENPTPQASQ
uniref:LIM domain binding 2 n=48 Tax=Aves TaxID=8782 RepID=A0A8B9IFH9_ANSCY|nr:LIM domain-binding protein 2 isoform X3 [Anser cygnoides]